MVALNNGQDAIPHLLGHSYNALVVGRSDGNHSTGGTAADGAGRIKPDLVAPGSKTSWATPIAGALAALILETVDSDAALADAGRPQAIKAILMAGATKDEFPAWGRTPDAPLDGTYGAGEVNVYNSYHILVAGKQEGSATGTVERMGWDLFNVSAGTNASHVIDVPAGHVLTRLSVVLSWPRDVYDGDPGPAFSPQAALADLDLYVRSETGTAEVVDFSTSRVDNVEHCWSQYVPEGRYVLEVTADGTAQCALAWRSRLARIPEFQWAGWTNGAFAFDAEVSPDMPYAIEATTNLLAAGWAPIATNTSATDILTCTDPAATNFPVRFYRLVPDP